VIALSLAATARAQPFVITDTCSGNTTRFAFSSIPTTPTSPTAGAEFNANPCDPNALNLFALWPLYEVRNDGTGAADLAASTFNSGNGQLSGPVIAPAGDSMQLQWSNVDGRGLFSARYTISIECCGPRCGATEHAITLTNLSANSIVVSLYAYADIDLNDSFGDDSTSPRSTANRHIVVDLDPCRGSMEFLGDAVTNFEIAAFPQLESRLLASGGPLVNTQLPFGPSDYTGAFEWRYTIGVGQSRTATFRLGHNCLRCPATASTQNYGAGLGVGPAPTIGATNPPVPGCPVELAITGPPNANGTLLIGFTQATLPIPGCLETLLLIPAVNDVLRSDSTGVAPYALPAVPDPGLCGLNVFLQAWFFVPVGPGCYPLVHSRGLRLVYGAP
jgi:hypothetical protein